MQRQHRWYIWFALVMLALVTAGCSRAVQEETLTAKFYYDRGTEEMKRKDYVKALADFQTIVNSFAGSEYVDAAQFMVGEARFKNEEYLLAAYEYDRVYKDFPSSVHASEAMYKRALCYFHLSPKAVLDQENTLLAIDDFIRFIDTYPHHELVEAAKKNIEELEEKLAYKLFRAAELYRKQKKYDAAIIYYELVGTTYPKSVWAAEGQFGIGQVYLKKKDYEKARDQFKKLTGLTIEIGLRERAINNLEKTEATLAKAPKK